ncbi:FkbM family methyltransferase [Hoeflea sp. TYP-13]|uniref:FkbM family methyltransferase n=1 Tax=Hoeflea sp. TYP-13 TaxID=3230023 RepID=UPI0034C5E1A7
MRAYPLENYCDRIAVGRGNLPEIPERALIRPLLKPEMVFVDIGANIGTYSLFVASQCKDTARILSFEPHPRTIGKLTFNARANGFTSIETINQGVGPEKGRMRLYSSGGTNIGTASILPEAASDKVHVDIKIVPLGDALKSRLIHQVDLMKIDIEGFEDRALLPLMTPEFEALWPRAVLIETVLKQYWQEDCVERLKALGYTISGDTGENLLLLHPMTEKLES